MESGFISRFQDAFCKHFIYVTDTQGKNQVIYHILIEVPKGGSKNAAMYTFYIPISSECPIDTGGACHPKKNFHLPTVHFQGRTVSFREGNRFLISEWIFLHKCYDAILCNFHPWGAVSNRSLSIQPIAP